MPIPAEEPRDPALARYVYERLAAATKVETAKAIAKRYKVAPSSLSNILRGGGDYGVGRRICTRLLPVLGHASYDDLLAAAYKASRGAPSPVYPSLVTLLGRHRARWSEAAIAAVSLTRLPTDPGTAYWKGMLDAIDGTIRDFERPGEDPLAAIKKRQKK